MKKIIMGYCLLHQMNTFGPKFFDFHAWVKKCHFRNFSGLSKICIFMYCLFSDTPRFSDSFLTDQMCH